MMENGKDKIKRLQVEQERLLHRLRQSLLETYNASIEISSVKKAISSENDGFFFANDDTANKAINKQLSTFAKQMNHQLLNGIEKSWEQGKESVDNKLQTIKPKDKEEQEAFERIKKTAEQSNRANAAKAFYNEKRGGFNISERIWNLAGNAKKEIEIILQNGIKEGKSADAIQKSLKGYLNEPEKLFRRVRNKETDKLEWSKAAQKYHPGQGVYRSAYKNIMRLVRTELKAANCEAVWQSMQSNPLITGYMIVLSNNHTTLSNGKKIPLKDICDDLQGTYPKSFKFRGWHPQCRCEMLPIMATSDERKDLYKKIFDDKRDEWKPKPIEDVPSGFKDWVEANKERQKSGGNVPYFVRDNFKGGMLSNGLSFATKVMEQAQLTQQIQLVQQGVIQSIYNKITQKVIDAENDIRKNAKFETAIMFDEDGNVLIDKRGAATSVAFTLDECSLMKDCVLTHNHPRGWGAKENTIGRIGNSFSEADVNLAFKFNLVEVRAVTPTYTFSMKRPGNGWGMTEIEMKKEYSKIEKGVRTQMQVAINKAQTTQEENRAIERASTLHYHLVWKRFAKKFDIEYTKTKSVQ